MSKIRIVHTWCTDSTLKIDNSALQKKTMVRFPSPSVTKIKSCMCDLSIFFFFLSRVASLQKFQDNLQRLPPKKNRQISRKLETKIENRLEKNPTDYLLYATFSSLKSTLLFETSRNTIYVQLYIPHIGLYTFVQNRFVIESTTYIFWIF